MVSRKNKNDKENLVKITCYKTRESERSGSFFVPKKAKHIKKTRKASFKSGLTETAITGKAVFRSDSDKRQIAVYFPLADLTAVGFPFCKFGFNVFLLGMCSQHIHQQLIFFKFLDGFKQIVGQR